MKRFTTLIIIALIVAAAGLSVAAEKPNVLVIMGDDGADGNIEAVHFVRR